MNEFSIDQLETALMVLKGMRSHAEKEIKDLNSNLEAKKINASKWRGDLRTLGQRIQGLTDAIQDLDERINDGY